MGTFLEFRASKKSEEKDYQHWLIFNMLGFWRDVAYIFNLYQFAVDDLDLLVIFLFINTSRAICKIPSLCCIL